MKLPLTESKLQKADASGNKTTIIKPANRGLDAAATLIKVGHEIGLDCVKRARPAAAAATTEDDYEFVPLSGGRRKGPGMTRQPNIRKRKHRIPVLPARADSSKAGLGTKGFRNPLNRAKHTQSAVRP